MTREQYHTLARTVLNEAWLESVHNIATAALVEPLKEKPGALLLYPPTRSQVEHAAQTLQQVFDPPAGEIALAVPRGDL